MTPQLARGLLVAVVVVLSTSCTGYMRGSDSEPPSGGSSASTGPAGVAHDKSGPAGVAHDKSCATVQSGPAPLRRLDRLEYVNTIQDVLGVAISGDDLPGDQNIGGFRSNSEGSIGEHAVQLYMDDAEKVADKIVPRADKLAPCDAGADQKSAQEACIERFVEARGRRLFRRDLGGAEVDRFVDVFRAARADVDYAKALSWVVHAMLVAPDFLYHVHQGDPVESNPNVERLSGYALADRLAYTLWKTAPDQALLDAAASGALDTPAGLRNQAERMLADDRARQGVAAFFRQWLGFNAVGGIQRDEQTYPEFDDDLRAAMQRETRSFIDHVFWDGNASLETLLTADYSFLNAQLAEFYGLEPIAGDGFKKVSLEDSPRTGLLMQASMLSSHAKSDQSAVIYRGKFVREALLCNQVPPPPASVQDAIMDQRTSDDSPQALSNRRVTDQACAACHRQMDLIGQGFERFDSIGGDRGESTAQSGQLVATRDINGAFGSPAELARDLVSSKQVHECAARNMLRFSVGRLAGPQDQCTLEATTRQFVDNDLNLRQLFLATVTSDSFRYVAAAPSSCPAE